MIATRRKHFVLYDNKGNFVFKGEAQNHSNFLKQYLGKTKNKKLSNLNLEGYDFSDFRDLNGYDFSGSNLSNATFANVSLDKANFRSCKMHNTSFIRAFANNVRFDFADIKDGTMNFSEFNKSSFFATTMDNVDASKSQFENADFGESMITHCDFEKSFMMASTFKNAHVVLTSFKGANLQDTPNHAFANQKERMLIYKEIENLLPDRTEGATFADCNYDDAQLSRNMRTAKWDKNIGNIAGRAISILTVAVAAIGIERGYDVGKEYLEETLKEHSTLTSFLGSVVSTHPVWSGAAVVVGIGLLTAGKEKTIDFLKETSSQALKNLFRGSRALVRKAKNIGGHIKDMTMLMANPNGSSELQRALQARSNSAKKIGCFQAMKMSLNSIFGGNKDIGDIIICDKRHYAMALEVISQVRDGKQSHLRDQTLVVSSLTNPETEDGLSPSTLIFGKDGSVRATWSSLEAPGKQLAMVYYDNNGNYKMAIDSEDNDIPTDKLEKIKALTLKDVLSQFEKAILNNPDMKKHNFNYDHNRSKIISGRHNSIFVENKESGLIDNGSHYAVLSPDIRIYAINGEIQSKDRAETVENRRLKRAKTLEI